MISVEGASGTVYIVIADGASAPVSDLGEARLRYNPATNALELSQNGSSYAPIGGGTPSDAPYNCDSSLTVMAAVCMTAADTIALAQADVISDRPVVGFISSKPTATTAMVKYGGELSGFTGLTPGATYYLSETPGQITAVAPTSQASIVQAIGWARNSTTLVIYIERDFVIL